MYLYALIFITCFITSINSYDDRKIAIEEKVNIVINELGYIYSNPTNYLNNSIKMIHECDEEDGVNIPCVQSTNFPNMTTCGCSGSQIDLNHISGQTSNRNLESSVGQIVSKTKEVHFAFENIIGWQYSTLLDGTTISYPGTRYYNGDYSLGDCVSYNISCFSNYNPVSRPWYRHSLIGVKDIVIVFDVSQRLRTASSEAKLKEMLAQILETLHEKDFAQFITFADDVNSWNEYLEHPIDSLKEEWLSKINNISFFGKADTTNGLLEAVQIMKKSKQNNFTNNCHDIIILISAGWEENSLVIINQLKPLALGLNLTIHTFNVGESDGEWLQQIACTFRGSYHKTKIEDLSFGLTKAMLNDVKHLEHNPTWSSPYKDIKGLGNVTTLTKTIVDQNSDLIGIYCVDFIDLSLAADVNEETLICLNPIVNNQEFNQNCGLVESEISYVNVIIYLTAFLAIIIIEFYYLLLHNQ
eukprot:TRINITY_DN2799_c0_g2_i1.p1 TRINITY_DN2799_c0_g2~~TRINITY_DN2799_c0_g2_i1.p1  ORF type:complete len:470 (+),score=115.82 TRINITY_DN2799_c0_g2_i1:999-2408(+)